MPTTQPGGDGVEKAVGASGIARLAAMCVQLHSVQRERVETLRREGSLVNEGGHPAEVGAK